MFKYNLIRLSLVSLISALTISAAPSPSTSTLDHAQTYTTARQTREQAAKHVDFLLHKVTVGSIATVYPEESDRPGHPFVSMEYHAPCLPFPSLLFLLLPISQSTRNIIHDPTHRTSYMIHEPFSSADNDGQGTGHGRRGRKDEQGEGRSLMDHARVVFTGTMRPLNTTTHLTTTPTSAQLPDLETITSCYTSSHPDSRRWLPGAPDGSHFSYWAEMVVEDVYYVGGFGDLHYIGHIPLDMIGQNK